MRLLGAVRLSRETDETTSPERQRKLINAYAAAHGHSIAAIAEDIDVSGAIAPADRPELGPWLARSSEWDALIVAKLDRLSRSLLDFMTLYAELERQGKVIICLDPMLDFTTPEGQAFAQLLMVFAELERKWIAARTKDAHAYIKQGAGYPGGQIPFGYIVVKAARGWAYAHDPEYAPVVREMVSRVLAGESMRQVAIWLNQAGVPTSRNLLRRRRGKPEDASSVWRTETVRSVLTSPAIAGLHAANGKPLPGSDGMPVQRCEGIIDRQTWERVKVATAGPAHAAHRVDANPLLQVAFCGACASPFYMTTNGPRLRYYRCAKHTECKSKSIPADLLEAATGELFLEAAGDEEIMQRVEIPAEDHTQELADVDSAMADIESRVVAGSMPPASAERMLAGLETRRQALAALPQRPAGFEMLPTGETFSQRWEAADSPGRRKLMSQASFRVMARKAEDGWVTVLSLADKELAERARAAAGGVPQAPLPFPQHPLAGEVAYPIRLQLYAPPGQAPGLAKGGQS